MLPKTKTQFKREYTYELYTGAKSNPNKAHGIFYYCTNYGYKYNLIVWNSTKKEAENLAWDLFNNPRSDVKDYDYELHVARSKGGCKPLPLQLKPKGENFS